MSRLCNDLAGMKRQCMSAINEPDESHIGSRMCACYVTVAAHYQQPLSIITGEA